MEIQRNLPSIVVTLGMSFVWAGLAVLLLPTPGGKAPEWIRAVMTLKTPYVPFSILAAIAIAMIAGIGGGVFAALFSDAGGAATGVGILVGLVLLVVFLAYLIFMIALELAFPAKIYASLTRDESAA